MSRGSTGRSRRRNPLARLGRYGSGLAVSAIVAAVVTVPVIGNPLGTGGTDMDKHGMALACAMLAAVGGIMACADQASPGNALRAAAGVFTNPLGLALGITVLVQLLTTACSIDRNLSFEGYIFKRNGTSQLLAEAVLAVTRGGDRGC